MVDLVASRAWKENDNIALRPTADVVIAMAWCLTGTKCAGGRRRKLSRPQSDPTDHAAAAPVAVIHIGIQPTTGATTIDGEAIEIEIKTETLTTAEVTTNAGSDS